MFDREKRQVKELKRVRQDFASKQAIEARGGGKNERQRMRETENERQRGIELKTGFMEFERKKKREVV